MKIIQESIFKALFASITILIATAVYAQSSPNAPTNLRVGGTNHYFTGLPMTADGWTDFLAMVQNPDRYNDSRIVYVSTSGNDYTGVDYSLSDPAIGNDPFNPTATVAPFATIAAGYARLRDGYPDIMLLKRGDVWNNDPALEITKRGKAMTEPIIIAAYGASGDLPKRFTSAGAFWARASRGPQHYVVIADIHNEPNSRAPGGTFSTGFSWSGNTSGLLIEGCRFIGYANNMVIQSTDPVGSPVIDNVALRRNVIADAWDGTTHCQGIYTESVEDFLIEENLWDNNGWHETYQTKNTHSRSLYLAKSPKMTVRGNIDARGSSGGTQMRHGGVYEYNLSLQNPIAVSLGHAQTTIDHTGYVRYNVILDAADIDTSGRGFGILIGNRSNNTLVYDNIVAHQKTGTTNIYALFITNETEMTYQPDSNPGYQYVTNTKFIDNIVYKWDRNGATEGLALFVGQAAVGVTVQSNYLQQPNGANLVAYITGTQHSGPDETWVFEDNTYYAGSNTTPFDDGRIYAEWIAHVSETSPSNSQVTFTDPERTIESYTNAVGLNPTGYQDGLEKFLQEARKQSRFNWRKEYTSYAVINYIREGFGRKSVSFSYATH